MEAPDRIIRRKKRRSRWCFSQLCIAITLVVLAIAVAIPVAVVFSRKNHPHGLPSTVILPLYIYPNQGAWDPLYEALDARPELEFMIIINPEDGPGPSQYPPAEYISEVQKLNSYSNVRTVGYVRTGYATRNITSVLQDVSTYAGWSTFNGTSLAMHGIFFDEAPNEYSTAKGEYFEKLNRAAKASSGLQGNRTTIHNPGTIPDARFANSNTDITVVFESSYPDFQDRQADLAALSGPRSQYSYMVHSVPASSDLRNIVDTASTHGEYLFLTTLTEHFYESFGSSWQEFWSVVPT